MEGTRGSDQSISSTFLKQVKNLWAASMNSLPPALSDTDVLIGVMGMTGVGKTSFIRELTELDMKVGHDLDPCKFSATCRHSVLRRETS